MKGVTFISILSSSQVWIKQGSTLLGSKNDDEDDEISGVTPGRRTMPLSRKQSNTASKGELWNSLGTQLLVLCVQDHHTGKA